jgi:hypothetical protein
MPSGIATPVAFTDYEVWVEVEGLPWAFGLNDRAAAFFSGRSERFRREGVKGLLTAIPQGVAQEVRPLEGDGSIGSASVEILDDDSGPVLDLVANIEREDGLLTLGADMPANGTTIANLAFTGTASEADYPAAGGIFYVGRETCRYATRSGSTFTDVQRAWHEVPGRTLYRAHTAGDVISPFPRFTRTRRAVVYVSEDGTEASK